MPSSELGITVYGCEPDEADAFAASGPRFGIAPTLVRAAVSASAIVAVPGHRCASVGHRDAVSARVLRALRATGVEHLSTRSIGVDHIDLRAAHQLGITVENVVYAPDGVADYTLMLILMALRHARAVVSAADRHDFRLGAARGGDLRDLTVGVVGVGHIGAAVVERLHGFGCRVLACNQGRQPGGRADVVPLHELLRSSDVVTLHVPLAAATHHLIGPAELAAMKPGAILVNTARGGLVDTGALVGALEAGQLGGAALDVLEGEEGIFYADRTARPVEHPFLARLQRLPNVVITPHTAYYTRRALHDTVEQTLLQCLRFERNRTDGQAQDRGRVRRLLRGA